MKVIQGEVISITDATHPMLSRTTRRIRKITSWQPRNQDVRDILMAAIVGLISIVAIHWGLPMLFHSIL